MANLTNIQIAPLLGRKSNDWEGELVQNGTVQKINSQFMEIIAKHFANIAKYIIYGDFKVILDQELSQL